MEQKKFSDQTGKTFIVTASNAGVGFETALALYEAGGHIRNIKHRRPERA